MCISCGCQAPDLDHGDADNITADTLKEILSDDELQRAADARGLTVEEVRENIEAARGSL